MRTAFKGVLVGVSGLWLLAFPSSMALAQEDLSIGSSGRTPGGVGGFKVGEGVYLRAGVAAEAGYDTNVFYNDEVQRSESAVLTVTPSLELTNAGRDEGAQPPMSFSLGASLLYREYLNDNEDIREQRAFNPTFSGALGYNSGGMSVALSDSFTRIEEPPYVQTGEPIVRDHNNGHLQFGLAPGGGRIQTVLRYSNALDLYENQELKYANRMMHNLMLDTSWKWLPKTALFLQGAVGYVQYLDQEAPGPEKYNSIPYQVTAGLRGLVTPKLTVNLAAGFADAIYDNEAVNPSGLSNLAVGAAVGYNPIGYTRLGLAYAHQFRDSGVLGNYYDLDSVTLSVAQQIANLVLTGFSRWEYRRYQGFSAGGTFERKDNVFQTGVQLDYFLQRWFYAGIGYANLINRSKLSGGTVDPMGTEQVGGLDFTKHVIVGRLGIKY